MVEQQGMAGRSQSLYRKYRPTTFDEHDLVGQDHVTRTLRNAVVHGRVTHAYLFSGPRGCGKTTTARLLAKAVNCEHDDPAQRPCNECLSCRTINQGQSVDIIEIDAASNRGIDDIRDLREKVKFAPAQLRKKFYIVDEVHQLTKDASNALLKTLEEPPPHAAFILATTEQDKVLETISSRCQSFVFHRIPIERTIERLRFVCEQEGLQAEDAALTAIARAATGSLRDALGLLDQLAVFGSGDAPISADMVRQVLGAGSGDQVVALIDAVLANDVAAGLTVINAVVDSGADARQFSSQVVEYLRALLHVAASPGRDRPATMTADPQPEHLERFTLGEIAEMVRRFIQLDYSIRHSAFGHLPLELCLVDLILARSGAVATAGGSTEVASRPKVAAQSSSRASSAPAPHEPERVPTPIRAQTANKPETPAPASPDGADPEAVPATAPAAAPTSAPALTTATLERIQELWPRIRQGVRSVNRRIEALLASADPYAVTDDRLTLVATYDFHRNGLNKDDARQLIEEVLAQVLGAPYHLHCISQEEARTQPVTESPPAESPAPPQAAVAPEATKEPDADIAPQTGRAADEPQTMRAETAPENVTPPVETRGVVADTRYINAVKNIFNAVEIKL